MHLHKAASLRRGPSQRPLHRPPSPTAPVEAYHHTCRHVDTRVPKAAVLLSLALS